MIKKQVYFSRNQMIDLIKGVTARWHREFKVIPVISPESEAIVKLFFVDEDENCKVFSVSMAERLAMILDEIMMQEGEISSALRKKDKSKLSLRSLVAIVPLDGRYVTKEPCLVISQDNNSLRAVNKDCLLNIDFRFDLCSIRAATDDEIEELVSIKFVRELNRANFKIQLFENNEVENVQI
ncbi:hypothetical protein ACFL08_00025 [Patescibacteria group bacterium]